LVSLLGGVERSGLKRRTGAPPHPVSSLLAVIGAVATLWGVLGFAIGGLHQVFSPTGDTLIVLQLNPFQNVIHIAWGVTLMAVADSPHRHRAAVGSVAVAAALAIAGPVLRSGSVTNVLALNLEADVLHAALAVVAAAAIAVGWSRRTEAGTV
jgi:hypothetical protein